MVVVYHHLRCLASALLFFPKLFFPGVWVDVLLPRGAPGGAASRQGVTDLNQGHIQPAFIFFTTLYTKKVKQSRTWLATSYSKQTNPDKAIQSSSKQATKGAIPPPQTQQRFWKRNARLRRARRYLAAPRGYLPRARAGDSDAGCLE